MREGSLLRSQPQPFDGRDEAALRPEPAARSDKRQRHAAPGVCLHAVSEGGQGNESPLTGLRLSDPSIVRFRAIVVAGFAALEARREEVNGFSVFTVAEGDTC